MDVRLHARNTELDDGFRETALEKLRRAVKVFDGAGDVDLELSEEHNPRLANEKFRVELTAPAGHRTVRVVSTAATPEAALDDAVDRFARQLRRLKEKLIDRSRRAPEPAVADDGGTPSEPEVVRVKQFVMKPMTVEEAALQMELLGHDFFFFLNASTDRQSVLYRRRDGHLGLIEPA